MTDIPFSEQMCTFNVSDICKLTALQICKYHLTARKRNHIEQNGNQECI